MLILSYHVKGIKLYGFLQMAPGVYEAQMILSKGTEGKELEHFTEFGRLFKDFYSEIIEWLKPQIEKKDLRFGRIIAAESAVNSSSGLGVVALSTDIYSEMVDRNSSFCIIDPCACRQDAELQGRGCGRPKDVCAVLGKLADIAIDKGFAKKISREQFLEAKMRASEAGCVNLVDNVKDPLLACSCCGCCCGFLTMLNTYNIPTLIVQSHFEAVLAADKCSGCGLCEKFCPMNAVTMNDKKAVIDYARCIGCGVCVLKCKDGALTLRARANYKPPEDTRFEYILNRIFEIKGYGNPLLPKISRGAGHLVSKISPFHLSGPGYKSKK
jgi:Pyruvate/2-oxoacid:ferredoxin oxidoreductase delta subunit